MNVDLARLQTKITTCICDLDSEQTQAGPLGKWKIQEIVEHLTLTYSSTEALIASRIAKGRPTEARPTVPQHCMRFVVLNLGYFPRGLPAPTVVVPATGAAMLDGDQIARRFSMQLERMDALLDEVSSLFGGQNIVASHVRLGPLSPDQWRRFHVIHGLHHARQIEAIRRKAAKKIHPLAEDPLRQ